MIKRVCIYMAAVLLTLYCFFLYEDEIVAAMLVAYCEAKRPGLRSKTAAFRF